MNTYPYIGKGIKSGSTALIYEQSKCIAIESKTWAVADFELCDDINESKFTNITTEYLANTKIKYESQEHKIFILNMIAVNGLYYFVRDGFIYVSSNKNCNVLAPKQIIIPLPPTDTNTNTPEEDFEMVQIEKNNGDNLMFGDADKCKEWPCVNDEVLTSDGNGVVKLLPDSKGYYVVSINGEYYQYQLYELEKPKTPEQELFESFWKEIGLFMNQSNLNKKIFESAFINNITKKPQ